MFKEFKAFIMRGNVLDLAVAVVIGAAFGVIVTSFVNDILMPPLGLLLGRVDFTNLFINLTPEKYSGPSLAEAKKAGAATLNYGLFINNILNFLCVCGLHQTHAELLGARKALGVSFKMLFHNRKIFYIAEQILKYFCVFDGNS